MQVQHGEHRDHVRVDREENPVRKIVNERSSSAFLNGRKLKRILAESRKDRVDLGFEAEAETRALALESERCFEDLELGLGRDVEPPHSAKRAKASQQL